MTKTITPLIVEAAQQASGLIKYMDKLVHTLAEARMSYAKAKVEFEKRKEEHSAVVRSRLVEVASAPHNQNIIDPRTGKSNAEWTKLVIEEQMDNDPAVMGSFGNLTLARDLLIQEENNVLNLADEIGALKAQAHLLTAILSYSNFSPPPVEGE